MKRWRTSTVVRRATDRSHRHAAGSLSGPILVHGPFRPARVPLRSRAGAAARRWPLIETPLCSLGTAHSARRSRRRPTADVEEIS